MEDLKLRLQKSLNAWGRLLRLPNLFSVPGDTLAGYALAGGAVNDPQAIIIIANLCVASLFAYISGLITNDLADRKVDAVERPTRPIPSGAVSLGAATVAACVAGGLAIAFSAVNIYSFINGILLVSCVGAYNFKLKNHRFAGPFSMGLCRFLNVSLGFSIFLGTPDYSIIKFAVPIIYAAGILVYIHGITMASASETRAMLKRPGRKVFLVGAILMYLTVLGVMTTRPVNFEHIILGIADALGGGVFLAFAYFISRLFMLPLPPSETQKNIGLLIRNLILIQAAAAACSQMLVLALGLFVMYGAAFYASKKFYGS